MKAKSLNKTQTDNSNMQTYMHGSSSLYDICMAFVHIVAEFHIFKGSVTFTRMDLQGCFTFSVHGLFQCRVSVWNGQHEIS